MTPPPLRVLFTGYAPVHFVCFQPLYERLSRLADVQIHVSGGMRSRSDGDAGWSYDVRSMYAPFSLPKWSVLSVDEIALRDFDVIFAGNTKMILPRSVALRIQIFHGISFRNKAIRPENMECDHYFVVGPYMHRRFIEAGLLRQADPRAVRIGFMKTDRLIDGSLDRRRTLFRHGFRGERPVLLYAPTGQKRNSLEVMGKDVIGRLLAEDRYDLLIKPHDHPKNADTDWFAELACFEGPHCRVVRDPDVVPLLHAADLLLTDASSVANEYALLDRPIVFLDTPELIEKAREAEHSMLDLDTWGRKGGVVVERREDLPGAVARSLAQPREFSDVRRRMVEDLFYTPGGATDAAMNWMLERITERRRSMLRTRRPQWAY
jgi:hypothetical protein